MFGKKDNHHKGKAAFIGISGLIIFLIGLVWFGNDFGWWSITFPFLPFLVLLIGLGMLLKSFKIRKCC